MKLFPGVLGFTALLYGFFIVLADQVKGGLIITVSIALIVYAAWPSPSESNTDDDAPEK